MAEDDFLAKIEAFKKRQKENEEPPMTVDEKIQTITDAANAKNSVTESTTSSVDSNTSGESKTEAEKEHQVILIDIDQLEDFPKNDFPPYTGVRLNALIESIKKFGILEPLLVTKKHTNIYIIISGHNRKNAAKIAELQKVPCRVLTNLTDEDAELIFRETNLQQRSFSELTHKQKAKCLAAHYELMKRQGYRNDLTSLLNNTNESKKGDFSEEKNSENLHNQAKNGTSRQIGEKLKSSDKCGAEFGLSARNFERYVRVAKLTEPLLDMLDNGHLKINAAYALSFVEDESAQKTISDYITNSGIKLTIGDAEKLKAYWQKYKFLSDKDIEQILSSEKKAEKTSASIAISRTAVKKYFKDDTDKKEIEETIIAALEAYFAGKGESTS